MSKIKIAKIIDAECISADRYNGECHTCPRFDRCVIWPESESEGAYKEIIRLRSELSNIKSIVRKAEV